MFRCTSLLGTLHIQTTKPSFVKKKVRPLLSHSVKLRASPEPQGDIQLRGGSIYWRGALNRFVCTSAQVYLNLALTPGSSKLAFTRPFVGWLFHFSCSPGTWASSYCWGFCGPLWEPPSEPWHVWSFDGFTLRKTCFWAQKGHSVWCEDSVWYKDSWFFVLVLGKWAKGVAAAGGCDLREVSVQGQDRPSEKQFAREEEGHFFLGTNRQCPEGS